MDGHRTSQESISSLNGTITPYTYVNNNCQTEILLEEFDLPKPFIPPSLVQSSGGSEASTPVSLPQGLPIVPYQTALKAIDERDLYVSLQHVPPLMLTIYKGGRPTTGFLAMKD
jgi:hypothetical protein